MIVIFIDVVDIVLLDWRSCVLFEISGLMKRKD